MTRRTATRILLATGVAPLGRTQERTPRKITAGAPQIFVDLADVESLENVGQIFHAAEKHPANPILRGTKSWEREAGGPAASFIYDADEKLFKCWYQGVMGDKEGATQYGPHTLCYATSADGIVWQRPSLNLHEIEGSRQNNVVVPPDYHEGQDHWESVMKDPGDSDPARRYKGFGWSSLTRGLHTMTSPDGLRWTHSLEPVVKGVGDAQSMMIDSRHRRYVVFLRSKVRLYSVSEDFVSWSKPEPSLQPPLGQAGGATLYNHMGFAYGDQYLGFVSYFHMKSDNRYHPRMDLRVLTSRDGLHYEMPGPLPHDRPPVVRCGDLGEWDRFMTMLTGAPPIRRENRLYIYYRGMSRRHKPFGLPIDKDTYESGALGLATIRVDGFASLASGFDGGRVTTRPFVFDHGTLRVNAKADFGRIAIEALDESQEPIPGFSEKDCAPLHGDHVEQPVRWEGADLRSLVGRPIRLRFHLSNARLYSYSVT
ncbi:MAG: hypothetical protein ACKV22_41920 [Bryobacteraceae bacterium]